MLVYLLFYALLFLTVSTVTTFILWGIKSKTTENRFLFQVIPLSFVLLVNYPLQLVHHIEYPGKPYHTVASEIIGITAWYGFFGVVLLMVIGFIRGLKDKNWTLPFLSIGYLVFLALVGVFHPVAHLVPLFIFLKKAKGKWQGSRERGGKEGKPNPTEVKESA